MDDSWRAVQNDVRASAEIQEDLRVPDQLRSVSVLSGVGQNAIVREPLEGWLENHTGRPAAADGVTIARPRARHIPRRRRQRLNQPPAGSSTADHISPVIGRFGFASTYEPPSLRWAVSRHPGLGHRHRSARGWGATSHRSNLPPSVSCRRRPRSDFGGVRPRRGYPTQVCTVVRVAGDDALRQSVGIHHRPGKRVPC